MKKMIIITGILFLFFPNYEVFNNAYQESLWTYSIMIREDRKYDFLFKTKGKIDEIKTWKRFRFGFPTQPITIDFQSETKIIQGRIEGEYLLFNMTCALLLILFIGLIWGVFKLLFK